MGAIEKLQADAEAGTDVVLVPLGDREVEVLPVSEWRASGLRALREGDFDKWAEKCLTEDGRDTWEDVDPTMKEVEAFFLAWSESTGQDTAKSQASLRSSTRKSTARR